MIDCMESAQECGFQLGEQSLLTALFHHSPWPSRISHKGIGCLRRSWTRECSQGTIMKLKASSSLPQWPTGIIYEEETRAEWFTGLQKNFLSGGPELESHRALGGSSLWVLAGVLPKMRRQDKSRAICLSLVLTPVCTSQLMCSSSHTRALLAQRNN